MVNLTPREESRMALHPTPSPGLPALCPYYTTESWGTQPLMAPALHKGSSDRLQQAQQAEARAHCFLQCPGEQASGASQDLESCIDFSLEALNQMILEIDPTFQLLPSGTAGPQAESTNSITSRNKKEEPEALGKDLGHNQEGCWVGDRSQPNKSSSTGSEAQAALSCGEYYAAPNKLLTFLISLLHKKYKYKFLSLYNSVWVLNLETGRVQFHVFLFLFYENLNMLVHVSSFHNDVHMVKAS